MTPVYQLVGSCQPQSVISFMCFINTRGIGQEESQIDSLKEFAAQTVPLGYMAKPEEIATAALFLASDDAKYVNGVELTVDGGYSQI